MTKLQGQIANAMSLWPDGFGSLNHNDVMAAFETPTAFASWAEERGFMIYLDEESRMFIGVDLTRAVPLN